MQKIKIEFPTTIVIFGAKGDLSQKKLYPAFFSLYLKGVLPDDFHILGVSRSDLSYAQYKNIVKESIRKNYKGKYTLSQLNNFLNILFYQQGLFEEKATYQQAAKNLFDLDKKLGGCTNKLFYLAVSPKYYELILKQLHSSGLTIPCGGKDGWTRVLIEKPFGSDYKTAQKLDSLLGRLFKEEQVFRIDHYLAKDAIQNILTFRFSNLLFEPAWNKKYIEKVEIKLLEEFGVKDRGEFYDEIGALRDVGQNHILQMLAAVAMENPKTLKPNSIRKKRAKLLSELLIYSKSKDLSQNTLKGQYDGYRNEKGVKSNSKTETYFKIRAFIENKRWSGVPFILESGKMMKESKAEIIVYFKENFPCFCEESHFGFKHQNVIKFNIQPENSIKISFFVRKPTLEIDYDKTEFFFKYKTDQLSEIIHDAYEKILYDCLVGDQTLFTSTDELLSSWRFITPIMKYFNKIDPIIYKKDDNIEKLFKFNN